MSCPRINAKTNEIHIKRNNIKIPFAAFRVYSREKFLLQVGYMESFTKILAIGIGGACGAIARHLLNVSPLRNVFDKFPLPTFLINVAGSFLIGFFLILLTDKWTVNDHLRFAVVVGFLGAFTTFSTFELEIWELYKDSHYATAFAYLSLSVIAGFAGVVAGM